MNLEHEIERCVKYLLDIQKSNDEFKANNFYDAVGLLAKLDSVERELASAVDHLSGIRVRLSLGQLDQFMGEYRKINESHASAIDSLATVRHAIRSVKNKQTSVTRAKELQKSAAKLAYALVGGRVRGESRAIALKIMDKAGLMPPPEASTLTRWLSALKVEDINVK